MGKNGFMRLGLKITAGVVGILAAASYATGLTPAYVANAPTMLTGFGAMVACSAKYVSGINAKQNLSDIGSYSPLLANLEVTYDDSARRVEAGFLGLKTTSAQYREGLGCALDIGDTTSLDRAKIPPMLAKSNALWPRGNTVHASGGVAQALLEEILAADNDAGLQTRALLVAKGGQLVAEVYAPGFDHTSKLLGWSMAKSFNALMVGNMEMRGLIDPAKKPVFAEWADDERAHISLDDMLHMASGLDLPEVYEPGEAVTEMLFTAHSGADIGLAAGVVADPGTHWGYSSGTSLLLSKLVYDRAGGTLDDTLADLSTHFIAPMGLTDFVLQTDPSGVFLGSSFMLASARDWARMGQVMLNGGTLNGHRIVTEDWVKRALTPNATTNKKAYGYQFWLNRGDSTPRWPGLPADSYAALGSRDQQVMIIPSKDTVIVRLGWSPDGKYPISKNFTQILAVGE